MPDLESSRPTPNSGNSPGRHHGYDPNQPRVPSGHGDGGQWTKTGRRHSHDRAPRGGRRSQQAGKLGLLRRQTLAVDNTQLLALRRFRSMFHSMNMLSLTATQGGHAIRARHRTVDGHRPEPAQIVGTAARFVDAADLPLAGNDGVVRAVLVDPGAKSGWAEFESHQPGPIASIICHMIKIARPRRTIQPPKQPRTPAELRSQSLSIVRRRNGQSGVPESARGSDNR